MADNPDARRRKTRTRQHIIADLSVNYVERQVLLAGYTLERITRDYGMDLTMTTFSSDGQIENELIWFQVKATDTVQIASDGLTASLRIESADLRFWLMEMMPVILVLYDVSGDRAFWVEIQEYVKQIDIDADEIGDSVTIRMPVSNLITSKSINYFRDRKEQIRTENRGFKKVDPTE
jgi:hypothetical protein